MNSTLCTIYSHVKHKQYQCHYIQYNTDTYKYLSKHARFMIQVDINKKHNFKITSLNLLYLGIDSYMQCDTRSPYASSWDLT